MQGCLFGDYRVELHKGSENQSWTRQGDARDALLLEFFFEQMQRFEEPVILDIGASTGPYSLLAKYHPGATVHAFEPDPGAYSVLTENIKLNGLGDRVRLYPCALMEKEGIGILKMPTDGGASGLATLGIPQRFEKWDELRVRVRTIDTLGIEHVDLIKIDVEGAELFVLMGGECLIRECQPGMVLEYVNAYQFGYDYDELLAFLRGLGYAHFEKVRRDAKYGYTDLWVC